METNSTQAVSADTTAQEPVVKRLRNGEVREDKKVFWCYTPRCSNGEWWMTPEQFAAKKAAEKSKQAEKKASLFVRIAVSPIKLRRGDVSKRGKVFWGYRPNCVDGEWWMSPEQFAAKKSKINAWHRQRRATNPLHALKHRLRNLIGNSLRAKGFRKSTRTATMLGCTYEEFKAHIESKFPPGMSWESFLSDGHLDHHIPLDAADTEAEAYALNHFTNLRPLWGPDNLTKNATLPEEHELPDNLHSKVKEIYLTAKARSA